MLLVAEAIIINDYFGLRQVLLCSPISIETRHPENPSSGRGVGHHLVHVFRRIIAGEVYVDDGNEGADGLGLFRLVYLQLRALKRVLFSVFRAKQVFLTERRVAGGLCPLLKEVCFIFNVRHAGNFALVVEVSYSTTRVFLRAISIRRLLNFVSSKKSSRRYTISVMNLPAMARGRWLNSCIASDMVWS